MIIPSRAIEPSGEAICRLCGVIVPASRPAVEVKRILGNGDLWITEYTITLSEGRRDASNVQSAELDRIWLRRPRDVSVSLPCNSAVFSDSHATGWRLGRNA